MRTVANDDAVVGRESGAARAALHWDIETLPPNLRRYARRLAHDVVAADDLVQECSARALARLHLYCQIQPLTPRCVAALLVVAAASKTSAGIPAVRVWDGPLMGSMRRLTAK